MEDSHVFSLHMCMRACVHTHPLKDDIYNV